MIQNDLQNFPEDQFGFSLTQSMLNDSSIAQDVLTTLDPLDFHPFLRPIPEAIKSLIKEDKEPSYELIINRVAKDFPHSTKCLEIFPLEAEPDKYEEFKSRKMEERSKRLVGEACKHVLEQINNQPLDSLKEVLVDSTISESSSRDFHNKEQLIMDMLNPQSLGKPFPLGVPSLQKYFNAVYSGELIYIGGRSGMGKTALALSMMVFNAKYHEQDSIFFSFEMDEIAVARRFNSVKSSIPYSRILETEKLSPKENKLLLESTAWFKESRIHINTDASLTIPKMESIVASWKRKNPGRSPMVYVDYLTEVEPHEKSHSDVGAIDSLCKRFKKMAKKLKIPIIILAQVSREAERSQDKKPQLKDLRGSGGIEASADIVLCPHRQNYYDKVPTAQEDAECIVLKYRNGPTGSFPLQFETLCMRYR